MNFSFYLLLLIVDTKRYNGLSKYTQITTRNTITRHNHIPNKKCTCPTFLTHREDLNE